MRTQSVHDPDFRYCSSELKEIFAAQRIPPGACCIDAPCGIGRNTFFLASRFDHVLAIDRNERYLKIVMDTLTDYSDINGRVTSQQMDLEGRLTEVFSAADLIVTIHYYSHSFAASVIRRMKPGALFYLETPSCSGENCLELPTDDEIQTLVEGNELLSLKRNACRRISRRTKSFSLKALIKKPYA
jgi:SAM-dependent methyltransferase